MSQLVKTKRQANFKGFKRFGALRGSSNKKTLYSTHSCVKWAFFGTRGPLKRSIHSRFKVRYCTSGLNVNMLYWCFSYGIGDGIVNVSDNIGSNC
jgi:hypothetical protein